MRRRTSHDKERKSIFANRLATTWRKLYTRFMRRWYLNREVSEEAAQIQGKYMLEETMKRRAFGLLKQLHATAQSLSNKPAQLEVLCAAAELWHDQNHRPGLTYVTRVWSWTQAV